MPMPVGSAYFVELDPVSQMRMRNMMAAGIKMDLFYLTAMKTAVNYVHAQVTERIPVGVYDQSVASQRGLSGGNLKRGIRAIADSPWIGQVGIINTIPYAKRREYGFDQQTDALGRYYPFDPKVPAKRAHMYYMRGAFIASIPFINETFRTTSRLMMDSFNSPA